MLKPMGWKEAELAPLNSVSPPLSNSLQEILLLTHSILGVTDHRFLWEHTLALYTARIPLN